MLPIRTAIEVDLFPAFRPSEAEMFFIKLY
nr:MAG TPA: hypothetical protein [Caudoviricetes sp.]